MPLLKDIIQDKMNEEMGGTEYKHEALRLLDHSMVSGVSTMGTGEPIREIESTHHSKKEHK